MISNQILQDTIEGIKAITRIDLCVMDTEGKALAPHFVTWTNMSSLFLHLWILRQRARCYRGTSFLKYLMITS